MLLYFSGEINKYDVTCYIYYKQPLSCHISPALIKLKICILQLFIINRVNFHNYFVHMIFCYIVGFSVKHLKQIVHITMSALSSSLAKNNQIGDASFVLFLCNSSLSISVLRCSSSNTTFVPTFSRKGLLRTYLTKNII